MKKTRRIAALIPLLALATACADQPLAPRGDEGAPPALSESGDSTLAVVILGPSDAFSGEQTWHAIPSGGNGTYTYTWEYRADETTTWNTVGYSSIYTRYTYLGDPSFSLRVTVTSGGQSASKTRRIDMFSPSGCGGWSPYLCP